MELSQEFRARSLSDSSAVAMEKIAENLSHFHQMTDSNAKAMLELAIRENERASAREKGLVGIVEFLCWEQWFLFWQLR